MISATRGTSTWDYANIFRRTSAEKTPVLTLHLQQRIIADITWEKTPDVFRSISVEQMAAFL